MNTLPPLPLVDGTLFIDASTLKRYLACPRQYEYYGLRKREAVSDDEAILFGRCAHLWLANHHLGKPDDVGDELVRAFFKEHPTLGASGSQRTLDNMLRLCTEYRSLYAVEPFDVLKHNGEPLVEATLAMRLGTITLPDGTKIPVVWTGRIDLVTVWAPNGSIRVVDHKTTSIEGPTFWSSFELDCSQLGYCWTVREKLGRVDGFVVNALCLTRGSNIKLMRQSYVVSSDVLDDWQRNVLAVVENLVADHLRGAFAMHTTSCVHRFGVCEYLPVCRCAPSERLTALARNDYRDVTWTPLD